MIIYKAITNVRAQSSNEIQHLEFPKEFLDFYSFVIDLTFGF